MEVSENRSQQEGQAGDGTLQRSVASDGLVSLEMNPAVLRVRVPSVLMVPPAATVLMLIGGVSTVAAAWAQRDPTAFVLVMLVGAFVASRRPST